MSKFENSVTKFYLILLALSLSASSQAIALPTVGISAVDGNAAEAGQEQGSFTVTRSGDVDLGQSLRVFFEFASPGGQDYVVGNASYVSTWERKVFIPANEFSVQVTLEPHQDNLVEGPETTTFTLQTDSAYNLGAEIQAAIEVADDVVVVHISAVDENAAEAGQDPGSFTVTRSNNGKISDALGVFFEFASPGGQDYVVGNASYVSTWERKVFIPANEFSAQVTLTPNFDLDDTEGDEITTFTLQGSSAYTLGVPIEAIITIEDLVDLMFGDSFED